MTGQRLERASASANASKRCGRIGTRALADAEAFNAERKRHEARRRRRVLLVWLRQHLAAQSVDHQASASRADGARRAASGRGRHRPGLEHRHRPDLRRRARPAAGDDSGWSAPTRRSRPTPARHRPRARPSSPARRRKRPARALREKILRFANVSREGGALPSSGARSSIREGDAIAAHRSCDACRRRGRLCLLGRGDLRSADHAARRQGPGQALRRLWLRRADRRARSRPEARHGAS